MKKLLLLLLPVLIFACTDYTDDITAIDDRLDKLEQALPSIDDQITSIKTQLASLQETDKAIKEQIAELEKSDKATATEISNLKAKDSALEKSISNLQKYVDDQIKNAKSEAAAAYATIEQYNTIVAQLSALQASTNKLGEELTAKIDAEVKKLNDKIADLENRLKAVEEKVENLLARIQSVSYIPEYADGKVKIERLGYISAGELSFRISPKDAISELEKVWSSALSCEAYYPKTRTVSLAKLTVTEFVGDIESGIVTVKVSGEGLSEEFFAGTQEAKIALVISDGNNQIVSEYADAFGYEITDEIWYTTTDGNVLEPKNAGLGVFGANIVSNTYENGKGVIKFDGTVTMIGDYAFGADDKVGGITTLDTITLPNSITSIKPRAFEWSSLSSVIVPNNVTYLGKGAFAYCENLTDVVLSNNVVSWDTYIFVGCISLKSVNIPKKVTIIPNNCFDSCQSLEQIDIHDNIISIGDLAFYSCKMLAAVKLGNNIKTIGSNAFAYCIMLSGDIILPQSLQSIGGWAFHVCRNLTSVTVGENLVQVGNAAFSTCTKLEYFYGKLASADNRCLILDDGTLVHLSSCISGQYTIPSNVRVLGFQSFSYPQNKVSLTIPETVEDIDERFTVGSKIEAFYGKFATEDNRALIKDNILIAVALSELSSYTVPNGVTKIREYVFGNTTKLRTVTLPQTITKIDYMAFSDCKNLETLYCKAVTPPTLGSDPFSGVNTLPTIYVPTTAVDYYKTTKGWKDYADKIVGYKF